MAGLEQLEIHSKVCRILGFGGAVSDLESRTLFAGSKLKKAIQSRGAFNLIRNQCTQSLSIEHITA